MATKQFIIVGFGRSGTTWLSDIISKVLGGVILFEPFHPKVFKEADALCYSSTLNSAHNIQDHIDKCSSKSPESYWLLRNHIQEASECSKSFIEYVWEHSKVIGYKTIRCNHLISDLNKIFDAHIIFIHRHPLAVLASIRSRPAFWDEFGLKWHKSNFFKRAFLSEHLSNEDIKELTSIVSQIKSEYEMIMCMWAISFLISMKGVKAAKAYILSYEDIYLNPFEQIAHMFDSLNYEDINIHPSHIFTPSLTTLNTVHGLKMFTNLNKDDLDKLFWKDKIDKSLADKLKTTIVQILKRDPFVLEYAIEQGYVEGGN